MDNKALMDINKTKLSRFLLQYKTVPLLFKKFPAFYGIRSSIPVLKKPNLASYPDLRESCPHSPIIFLKS
jgi:hypothetical protein